MQQPVMQELEPGLRVLRANNPSPMTGTGTNTYILGNGPVCVIDPGPEDAGHLDAILSLIGAPARLQLILVTHSHMDHSPLARPLAQLTGAPVLAFGDSLAGQSALMQTLARQGLSEGGEGVDRSFQPDRTLRDNELVTLGEERITAIWTPGHMGNHMCFHWRDAVFTGDHVMGWASSLVSPPDGNMGDYMRALDRLAGLDARVLYPGHGAPVRNPAARITELTRHREGRMRQILSALHDGPAGIDALVARIYADIPPKLHPAAARNVYAHLIDLFEGGDVTATPGLSPEAEYALARQTS